MKVLEYVGILLGAAAPWIVAIVYLGRKVRGDGFVPKSMGEYARQRMNVR